MPSRTYTLCPRTTIVNFPLPTTSLFSACPEQVANKVNYKRSRLVQKFLMLLEVSHKIAETIIGQTHWHGVKDSRACAYVNVYIRDCLINLLHGGLLVVIVAIKRGQVIDFGIIITIVVIVNGETQFDQSVDTASKGARLIQ
jgi:hypothetical protein